MSISLPLELKRNRIYGFVIVGSSAGFAIFLTYFAYVDFTIPLFLLSIPMFASTWVFYPMTLKVTLDQNGIKQGNTTLLWSDIHTISRQSYKAGRGSPPHVTCTLIGDKQKIKLFLYSKTEALLVQEILTAYVSKKSEGYKRLPWFCDVWERKRR